MFKSTKDKIVSVRRAIGIAARLRRQERRIVATNGSFDILHAGHVDCLERARRLGSCLFVAINSDASVRRNKGPRRPVVAQRERALMLAALACVDYVVVFGGERPDDLLEKLRPHFYAKGGSFAKGRLGATRKLLAAIGCKTVVFPLKRGLSSSAIIDRCVKVSNRGK